MQLETFRMIDAVEAVDLEARRITCRAVVPGTSPVFDGHFPGHPLVPGVLLIETMAQAAGHLALALEGWARMPFLFQVRGAKFRSFVGPGAVLSVEARIAHEGSGFVVAAAALASAGARVAEAEIMLRFTPFPAPELRADMWAEALRLGLGTLPGLSAPEAVR